MATIAKMLYNRTTKLLREGEIGTFETRFYSSDTPNENYRIGQKHVKGKIIYIHQESDGFSFKVDISEEYNGKYNEFKITKKYIDMCYIKCIVFVIDSTALDGTIEHKELVISADEWLSTNTFVTTGIVEKTTEQYSYNVGDIVELRYTLDNNTEEKECRAKLIKIKSVSISDDSIIFKITFDASTEFNYNQFTINDSNIIDIKLYKKPEIEHPWEDD